VLSIADVASYAIKINPRASPSGAFGPIHPCVLGWLHL